MNDTLPISTVNVDTTFERPKNLVLYNDNFHSMDEVANQICKAINCDQMKAAQIMLEAHMKGRAIVFTGSLERCELVESILNEIRLGTKIEEC